MQTDNRLLDDLARVANGALATISGLREEIETRVRERVERMLTDMDMVPREEFDAVSAMAQQARTEQEELSAKVARLEQQLAELQAKKAPAPKKAATGKASAKRTSTTKRRTATKAQAGKGAVASSG